jgi:hypothetical protein
MSWARGEGGCYGCSIIVPSGFSSAFQFSVTFDFPPDSQLQLAAQPAVNVPGSR